MNRYPVTNQVRELELMNYELMELLEELVGEYELVLDDLRKHDSSVLAIEEIDIYKQVKFFLRGETISEAE